MNVATTIMFAFGYPVSIAIIVRWVPVVREQRLRWFVAHTSAVAAIVAGWALRHEWRSVGVNATWLVVSILWYQRGWSRRRADR